MEPSITGQGALRGSGAQQTHSGTWCCTFWLDVRLQLCVNVRAALLAIQLLYHTTDLWWSVF